MSEFKTEDRPAEAKNETGAFQESLYRNNKRIRQDRADQIIENAQIIYKRECEDLALAVKQLAREQEAMLDLSPTDAKSLILASDFDAKAYVNKDLKIGVDIRNLRIKYEVAVARYAYLFGEELNL